MSNKEVVYVCPEIVDDEKCNHECKTMSGLSAHMRQKHGVNTKDRPNSKQQG